MRTQQSLGVNSRFSHPPSRQEAGEALELRGQTLLAPRHGKA